MMFLLLALGAGAIFAIFRGIYLLFSTKNKKQTTNEKQELLAYNHLDALGGIKMKAYVPSEKVKAIIEAQSDIKELSSEKWSKQLNIDWDKVPSISEVINNPPKFPQMIMPVQCHFCGEYTQDNSNYCDFTCMINEAVKMGGKTITPNNLPITCIESDWTMKEHEWAEHPNYMFPIYVECVDKQMIEEDPGMNPIEFHAVVQKFDNIILTLYEGCYTMWSIDSGKCLGGFCDRYKWKITDESMKLVKERFST